MTIRIILDDKHIRHGVRGNCGECPTALAIIEQLPDSEPEVTPRAIHLVIEDQFRAYVTPQSAIAFIRDFDNGLPVSPFEFTLIDYDVLAEFIEYDSLEAYGIEHVDLYEYGESSLSDEEYEHLESGVIRVHIETAWGETETCEYDSIEDYALDNGVDFAEEAHWLLDGNYDILPDGRIRIEI